MDLYHLRVFVALSLVFGQLCPSDCKLCCEPECSKPISYGRTQQRHITRDMGFLSYPASAIVTVLVKGAYFGENGEEFWEAEIQGKRGLIRSTAINEMTYKCQPQDFFAKEVEDGLPEAGTSHETVHQSNSDQISPTTEQDLVSSSRPVDDQLDVIQLPTQEQDDRFDTPASGWKREEEGMHADEQGQPPHSGVNHLGNPKTDPDHASFSEDKPAEVHHDEKPVEPDQQVSHDGKSGIPVASQTFERFNSDQNQRASKEHENAQQPHVHRLFETPPPMATPPPDAVLPDEMLALLNSPYPKPNNGRVVREDHVTFASSRSDQFAPVVEGNLPRDSDKTSSGDPQQSIQTNEARSPETGSQEDRNIDSGEQADHVDGSDSEKLDLKLTDLHVFDQSEDNKPSPAEDSESKTTTSNGSADQMTSDPRQSSSDSNHPNTNQQNKEEMIANMFDDDDDDYYDDHYWDDVAEPEYTSNNNLGQTEEPELPFEPLEEEEQQRPSTQEVSEEQEKESERLREEYTSTVDGGDGSGGDSQGQTQSLPSSNHTQSDTPQSDMDTASSQSAAEAPPSEAPPTDAPPSVVSSFEAPPPEFPHPPDTYHSEFGSPSSSEAQPNNTEDKAPPPSEGGDPSSASVEDRTLPTEGEVPSPEDQLSGFENKTPPSEAETDTRPSEDPLSGTEAPPTSSEAPPPSQSDGDDNQQVDAASKFDPSLNDVDHHESIGVQSSHLHLSPSVTQLPGGDSERPNMNSDSDSEKDYRVEQMYSSSQLPSEEQKQESKDDEHNVFVDGTHLPDDDDDDDDIRTTPFQSPVFTQSVASTPIPGSDSTNVGSDGDIRNQEPPSLDELMAEGERLRAQWERDYQQAAKNDEDSNTDSHTIQEARTDHERAGVDNDGSSNAANQQSEDGREALHMPRSAEDSPNQVPDQSEPLLDDGATPPPPPYNAYGSKEGGASGEDTPTPLPADADSAFEEPPPPPRVGYSCRDDYLPMPGHNRGGWMAYHEQVRAHIRDLVLDALPREWSDWVCHNRPVMAVIMTSVICFSLFVPIMMIWCFSGRSGKQKLKEVHIKLANYRKLEEDLSKAQHDKSVLERKMRESEDRCQDLQDKFSLQKQEFDGLAREKEGIEAHYHSVTGALTTAQQEINQYLANTEQLNAQITHLQSQVAAVVSEREGALEQATQLSASIQELEQKVQGLEAQKDQLEEDRFTAQTALQELQSQHEQTKAELEETKEQCEGLRNDLGSVSADLEAKLATLTEKEEELQILRSCLSQVTEQAAATTTNNDEVIHGGASPSPGGEAVDGEQEGEAVGEKKQAQLEKIQAMLNTTKVQLELRETTEERDRLLVELKEKTAKLEDQIAENEQLNSSYSALATKEQETAFQLKELELKMKGVKEYFQEKERDLHKRIEVGEVSRMRYEQLESEAQEKATVADQERQRERQELTELRDQITEIEKSYSNQIKNTELRAGGAIASLRRTEQELRQANREITVLRRRLSEFENAPPPPSMMRPIPARGPGYPPLSRTRPPSTGPPPPREGGLQPPRPISAPRLDPRTSSPSGPESLGPLPSLPAVPRVPPGGGNFHKSQSSSAMLNTSLPPLGTPGTRVEGPNRPGSKGASSEHSLSAHPSSSSISLTNLPSSSSQPTGEQRAGERLPPPRQAPPPQARPASTGHPPLKTPPVPTTGSVAPPPPSAALGRPIPPSHPGRIPPYGYPPPQPYAGGGPPPPPAGGRMYRGPPPPSTAGRPPYPGGQYPPPPRQPMAPPSSGGMYRPPPPPQGSRIRTPGPPPPSGYPSAAAITGSERPAPSQPRNTSWQQPPPPSSRGHPAPTGEGTGNIPKETSSYGAAQV